MRLFLSCELIANFSQIHRCNHTYNRAGVRARRRRKFNFQRLVCIVRRYGYHRRGHISVGLRGNHILNRADERGSCAYSLNAQVIRADERLTDCYRAAGGLAYSGQLNDSVPETAVGCAGR